MEQRIVVHTKEGMIHKGVTQNFDPLKPVFHFLPAEGGGVPMRLELEDMKALFWVRDYIGNRHFVARRRFDETEKRSRAIVTFQDGEEIWGMLEADDGDGVGFFLDPTDGDDNNIRIFVIRSALKEMRLVS